MVNFYFIFLKMYIIFYVTVSLHACICTLQNAQKLSSTLKLDLMPLRRFMNETYVFCMSNVFLPLSQLLSDPSLSLSLNKRVQRIIESSYLFHISQGVVF